MQAALCADFYKGGWSAAWEATGGPQQFSGGKGGNGFTVDEGTMSQFILSKMAAGFKGFGLWCWSTRTAGWEAGEYALLDRHNKVTPRAVAVGKIAQAMEKYRDEIWQARKEPSVGVLYDWDNEALWAAMSSSNRDSFRMAPVKARVGISRALINANIPFEYVLAKDLRKGLAKRYKVIYLPGILGLNQDLLPILTNYVKEGGKVVIDMPGAWFNETYALLNTDKGSDFEKLFGTIINEYQYSGINRNWTLDGKTLYGFTTILDPTSSTVVQKYGNGKPAITENKLGKGSAVILGYEASTSCFKTNQPEWEQLLIKYSFSNLKHPYSATGATTYRLGSSNADHYFLINDKNNVVSTTVQSTKYTYKSYMDAVTGETLSASGIDVPANSARWVRAIK
jgi:beta-galactosidase